MGLGYGVARRSAIVSDSQSWAGLGVERSRPIPDGLARLDLGAATAPVLARLVSGGPGSVVQETGVECRPSGLHRQIQFTAHFFDDTESGGSAGANRIVRGFSVDLGPSEGSEHSDRSTARLGELVAQSLADPHEYRAIADPVSLRLLYWYGDAPSDIAWRATPIPGAKPVLHPEDRIDARAAARALQSSLSGATLALKLRYLTHSDAYAEVPVTARAIDLDDDSRAILLTLHM